MRDLDNAGVSGDLDWMVKNFDNPFLAEKFVTWLQGNTDANK